MGEDTYSEQEMNEIYALRENIDLTTATPDQLSKQAALERESIMHSRKKANYATMSGHDLIEYGMQKDKIKKMKEGKR